MIEADSQAHETQRLAQLMITLERNRCFGDEMQKALEPLERGGIIGVSGEAELLQELQQRLEHSKEILERMTTSSESGVQLAELESLLTDSVWEDGRACHGALLEKQRSQDEEERKLQLRKQEWSELIATAQRAMADAKHAGAPVAKEIDQFEWFKAIVDHAKRALDDKKYAQVNLHLYRLDNPQAAPTPFGSDVTPSPSPPPDSRTLKEVARDLNTATEKAKELSGRTELLLIQGPLVNGSCEYTVLLRTPTALGAHGMNVQDVSPWVVQDRAWVLEILDKTITPMVNRVLDPAREIEPNPESTGSASPRSLAEQILDVGGFIYSLLVPNAIQFLLRDGKSSLTITTNDMELPWELMHDGENYLCLTRPLARMPMGGAFPHRPRPRLRRSNRYRFLLLYADANGKLKDAHREVEEIKRRLEVHDKWGDLVDFTLKKGEEVTGRVLNRLLRDGEFDVIHYAGHATYDKEKPGLSGLLLHDKEMFFAQKIQRLLAGQPLVFLNACESSRTANEQDGRSTSYMGMPAQGLSSAFVYGGAMACIGSLWPVFDDQAADFAIKFYGYLIDGLPAGEALRLARVELKETCPEQITWASYVLYGDPTYRLEEDRAPI
ncbi:MAG: CHAT domain-containing protein [Egibacteraceae bacterium]